MTQPFAGLSILDLSTGIPGAFATRHLVDAGARVVQVEPPGGDPLRRHKTSAALGLSEPLAEGEDGALFQWLRAGQQSVVLDLEEETGRAALRRLYAGFDVVIEGFAPGWLEARDLGATALRKARPDASLVSITPFGQDGPWRDRPATEFTLQAETGAFSGRGYADLGPVVAGGRLGDYATGSLVALTALAAWTDARATGRGRHVDVSQLEAMLLCFQPYQYIQGQMRPGEPMPVMVEVPSIEPAADGMVGFSTQTSQQWQDLCRLIGRPDWAEDESLCMGYERFLRRDELLPVIRAWTSARKVEEIVELAGAMRIPVAPIGNGETVLETDHLEARGFFRTHPAGFRVPGVPFRLDRSEPPPLGSAPALGADTERVLAEVGDVASASAADPVRPIAATDEGTSAPALPLSGLKVVDFSAFWAGPFAATVLASLGADVVKVESIQRPDGMRFASGFIPEDGRVWEWAPVFHGANSGKLDVTLNLDDEEGLDLAKRLVAEADVVLENFSPRVMERFGLDREGVRALNPEAVLVRMPAFGLDGPWRDRVGFAMTIEQASGLAWVTGFPEREPIVPRGICDPVGGMTALVGLFAALEQRAREGGGQQVEVALIEAGLSTAGEQVVERSAYGVRLERTGNRGPAAAPQGVYVCRDARSPDGGGWIAIAVEDDAQWAALGRALGEPDWAADPVLADAAGRRAQADRIDAALAAACADQDARALADRLTEAGVPAAALHDQRGVVPGHPQLDARGFLAFLEHPFAGRIGYPHFAARFDEVYGPRTPPPTLGEHNEVVLGERLGLGSDRIEALRARGVIGTKPSFL